MEADLKNPSAVSPTADQAIIWYRYSGEFDSHIELTRNSIGPRQIAPDDKHSALG